MSQSVNNRRSDTYVQSLDRGLAVIRSYDSDCSIQTISQVAQRTGLTRPGARRILLTLLTLGYVVKEGRGFRLTPRILDLGYAYLSSMPIPNFAGSLMEDLASSVHESCSIGVLDKDEVVYVLRVHTRKIISSNLAVGSRLPAFWTSMGRVLLSTLSDDILLSLLNKLDRTEFTVYTKTTDEQLLNAIREVRKNGWALVNQELEEGLISIAVPLIDRSGGVIAALNVSGQANRSNAERMVSEVLPKLLKTASEIAGIIDVRSVIRR